MIPVQTIMGTAGKLGKLDLWEGNCHMIPIEDTKRYTETVKKFMSGWFTIIIKLFEFTNTCNGAIKDYRIDDWNIQQTVEQIIYIENVWQASDSDPPTFMQRLRQLKWRNILWIVLQRSQLWGQIKKVNYPMGIKSSIDDWEVY